MKLETPDEIRSFCAKEIIDLGRRLQSVGTTFIEEGIRTVMDKKRVAGALGKSLNVSLQIQEAMARPYIILADLEKKEAALRAVKPKRKRRGRKASAMLTQQGTVVRGLFPPVSGMTPSGGPSHE